MTAKLLPTLRALLVLAPLAAGTATATSPGQATLPGRDAIADTGTAVLDAATLKPMEALIDAIADRRVIFIGESHDRYEDHLNQLAIIRGLVERGKAVAIGMEFFQQPFQTHLDAFSAGAIGEADLLRKTEYFDRWRYDYRLYRPLLRYARDKHIPLIALNLPAEITAKVGAGGIAALSPAEAAQIPAEIDRGDAAYRNHVKAVFDLHPQRDGANFEHFLEVQLLWDEGMAERAAAFVAEHPDSTLVVLAGSGHIEYGRGIPARLTRRVAVHTATVVNGTQRPLTPGLADYVLFPQDLSLPTTGLLGVMLDTDSQGEGIGVKGFSETSGAKAAGVKTGDRIIEIDGTPIAGYADVRIALMDSPPGQRLPITVLRKPLVGEPQRLPLKVELH